MSLRSTLETQNQHLLRDINRLSAEINDAQVIDELKPYLNRVVLICDEIKHKLIRNLQDLNLNVDSILEDVLSNTQQTTQIARLLSSRMVTPILRCSPKDKLGVKVISWLHAQHKSTAGFPAAFTDGDCAIWPFVAICPVYFFPFVEQRNLLYLPLYFHEFGHLLYRIHEKELNNLVQDMQREADVILRPPSQRSDGHMNWQTTKREAVVNAWYKWMQELFCDAIGLAIGGPAFIRTFSTYMSTFERGDFYRNTLELVQSDHPISLLRIRILTSRGIELGLDEVSNRVMDEWQEIANEMEVKEDYHGFYDKQMSSIIQQTINDMLTEVEPCVFRSNDIEVKHTDHVIPNDSPVSLMNKAWAAFSSLQYADYTSWEFKVINDWQGN